MKMNYGVHPLLFCDLCAETGVSVFVLFNGVFFDVVEPDRIASWNLHIIDKDGMVDSLDQNFS